MKYVKHLRENFSLKILDLELDKDHVRLLF